MELPVVGNFDLEHLQAIRKRLFGKIYAWAGELRSVDLDRGTPNPPVPDLYAVLQIRFLTDSGRKLFNILQWKLCHAFWHLLFRGEFLHAFRDGNGRTQRAFFSLLAMRSGKHIAWDKMDYHENISASIAAYRGNEDRLCKMLAPLIKNL